MGVIFTSAWRALKSLLTPGIPKLFLLCSLLSVGVLAALFAILSWLLNTYLLPAEHAASGWVALLEVVGGVMLTSMFFPLTLPVIVSFFDDAIADAIEKHEYHEPPFPQSQPFWNEFWHDVRFSIWAIFLNILCLPLYLILPGFNVIIFYGLNAYLLGRQFFVMIAARYMPRAQAIQVMRSQRSYAVMGGLVIVFLSTIPVLNLAAPFWGVALMVHLYHRLSPDFKHNISILPPQ